MYEDLSYTIKFYRGVLKLGVNEGARYSLKF